VVSRATARPVCDALLEALATHGIPEQILTDNGKVFTGRLGRKPTNVLFDRICLNNGIRHLLTAPYSPTTTGKIERLHKTMRKEFFSDKSFGTIDELQAALDVWVGDYNNEREHQSLGDVPPMRRFELARPALLEVIDGDVAPEEQVPPRKKVVGRRIDRAGRISIRLGNATTSDGTRCSRKTDLSRSTKPPGQGWCSRTQPDGLAGLMARGSRVQSPLQRQAPGTGPFLARGRFWQRHLLTE
jgi:Integrase core domain